MHYLPAPCAPPRQKSAKGNALPVQPMVGPNPSPPLCISRLKEGIASSFGGQDLVIMYANLKHLWAICGRTAAGSSAAKC